MAWAHDVARPLKKEHGGVCVCEGIVEMDAIGDGGKPCG